MTSKRSRYDVVVAGGRVAGSATAMLLARLGHDVVVVDQASFPSDTAWSRSSAGGCSIRSWTAAPRPSGRSRSMPLASREPHDQAQGRGRPCRLAPAVRAGHDPRGRRRAGRHQRAPRRHRDRRAAGPPLPGGGHIRARPRRCWNRYRRPVRDRRRRPAVAGGPFGRRRDQRGAPGRRGGPVRLLRGHPVDRHRALRHRTVVRRSVPSPSSGRTPMLPRSCCEPDGAVRC